jgi:AcrR family transcriptional regulator
MATADRPDARQFTAKGRATRQRILQAAAEVILTEGLSGLSMDKVRKAASVSGSQLTHYYADKQALIRAVLERQIEVVLDFHRQPRLGRLDTFDDYEQWIDSNFRYLRRVGYTATPTYHALAGQLVKSDGPTRQTLGAGYRQWIGLLEQSIQRMKDHGVLVTNAEPASLAKVLVAAHQGGATMAFTYRQEWPLADALRFGVNYLRLFAAGPAERVARRPRRARDRRALPSHSAAVAGRFTSKGLATRARIVDSAAQLMFKHGVVGTSLDDVRTTAGVSGSQIAHYFTDKRDLTRQVIAARTDNVLTFHTQPQLGGLDSIAALRAWADACIADVKPVYLRGGCVYGSLTGELLEADGDILDDLADGYDQWMQLFRKGIAAMRRRGDLTSDADPRHLATALVAAHQGGTMLTYAMQSAEPFDVAVTAAVDYVASFRVSPVKRTTGSRSRSKSGS